MASRRPALLRARPPGAVAGSDPLTLQCLLDGWEHVGLDRRGTFQPTAVTLWQDAQGLSTGAEATLVGSRPGNILIVLADFALNQGQRLRLDKRLQLRGPKPNAACHVLSSRPGMRADDRKRGTYVLELQRERA